MRVYEHILKELRPALSEAGFELLQPLQVGWYNRAVEAAFQLDELGSPAHLALVIGNTRALWPKFLAALRRESELAHSEHPLDSYTERSVTRAVTEAVSRAVTARELPVRVRWSHAAGEQPVAMQHLAHAAGLAYLSESHLSVHPTYGPWIGLRAAVSMGVLGPLGPAPELRHPCGGCAAHCWPAFERALAALQAGLDQPTARANWQLLLACRDACPTGREHRYSDSQIRYHYLGDRQQLR
jgi:cyanocobalamin reductase (cyanide-eliminating) / alkylcobalamin dealkylase